MKRKITQIGRLFVAAALFFGASSWTNAAETTEIAINPQSKTADEGATWTFGDYVITNTAGKTYSTGGDGSYIKFSAADFAIAIPEGKQVVSFKIEGTSNYAEGPSILKKLNGEEFGDEQYVLPIKGEQAASHTITFTTPVTGNLPFTISGKQAIARITLGVQDKQEVPEPSEAPKVAYLCGATETTEGVYNALVAAGMDVTALNYDDKTLTGELEADGLAGYDLVVLAGKTGSKTSLAKTFDKIVGKVPVLSTKAFWYDKIETSWGTGVNKGESDPASTTVVPTENYAEHPVFAGIVLGENSTITVFNEGEGTTRNQYMQGFTTTADAPVHIVLASANNGGLNSIAEAWVDNKGYMIIPFDATAPTVAADGLTEAGAKLFVNAANYLIAGEQYEVPYVGTCPKPVITTTRIDQTVKYTLSITATAEPAIDGLKIYYTIDGSEPTAETGTLYDAETPVELVNDCTVKAIACADKYRNSEVAEYAFVNEAMTKLATPVIATVQNEKDVTVTITSTNEGVEPTAYAIYYTIDGTEPTANSKVYTDPFTFAGGSATVKAIAIGEGYKNSDVATQQITNTGYVAREKTLYQSDFNMLPTNWGYYDAAAGDDNIGSLTNDPNTPPSGDITLWSEGSGEKSAQWKNWTLASNNTRIMIYKQTVAESGNYSPATEADAGASNRALYFTNSKGGSTTYTYNLPLAAPFDITMFLGTGSEMSNDMTCIVSVADALDGEWETIGTLTQRIDKRIHKHTVSYDGTGNKYIRVEFPSSNPKKTNGLLFDFIVKGIGQDELTLLSMSPTAGTKEEPKEIDKAQTVFTATFNLNAVIGDAVAYFGAPVEGEAYTKNCEIVAEGNKVTITRPEADKELAAGNYVLYLSGVKDEQGAALKTPITAYYYVKAQLPTPTLAEPKQEDTYVSVVVNPLAEEYTDYNFYYTTDGSTPTTSSFLYDGTSIKFYGESATIKVIAAGEKYIASGVAEVPVVNDNYMAREKVVYTNDFHTPHSEWFYLVDFTYDEADTTKAVNAVVKDGAVWPEGITYTDWTEKDHFRVHIFPKGNEYTGYRQYAGWSFYGENGRRMILQDNKGLALLGSSGKASVAPDSMFVGPFDIDIQVSGAKSAAKVQIFVGDELEGNSWELIGEATAPAGEKATITGSYNGTDKKYVRVETTTSEIYFDKFIVKAPGYGELKLQSVSPAGGAYDAPAVLEETADTFVLTFNNPLATEQDADLVVFFAAPALPVHNCTYTIEGNTMTVTRPDATTPLAAGTYQFIVKGVKDVAGQVLGSQLNTFYKVEGSSSSVNAPEVEKTVVSTVIYSISGAVQSELAPGLNFVRTTYSDGTVEVEKVIKK